MSNAQVQLFSAVLKVCKKNASIVPIGKQCKQLYNLLVYYVSSLGLLLFYNHICQ